MHANLVFKPHWAAICLNWMLTFILWAVTAVLFTTKGVHIAFSIFLGIGGVVWLRLSLRLLRAAVVLDDAGVKQRGGRGFEISWSDIVEWSQHGEGNNVYFRDSDGRVWGFDPWCVPGKRSDIVASAFKNFNGPPASVHVMPPMLSAILGSRPNSAAAENSSGD